MTFSTSQIWSLKFQLCIERVIITAIRTNYIFTKTNYCSSVEPCTHVGKYRSSQPITFFTWSPHPLVWTLFYLWCYFNSIFISSPWHNVHCNVRRGKPPDPQLHHCSSCSFTLPSFVLKIIQHPHATTPNTFQSLTHSYIVIIVHWNVFRLF